MFILKKAFNTTHGESSSSRVNVLERNGEVDQIKINVSETPGLVLELGHGQGMLALVVVVPELGGDKDVLTLDEALADGALDTLASLLLVLVVVRSVEESVTSLDGL